MKPKCPNCEFNEENGRKIVRHGFFYRTSDSQKIRRFFCRGCRTSFSLATGNDCFRQKKRNKNEILRKLLCSGVSLRRSAKILHLHRVTVVRKFLFLSKRAEFLLMKGNHMQPNAKVIEFDDMETFEHSKCKPLSITLAVEAKTRRILGIQVTKMPAKGLLVRVAKKYGPRRDERRLGRKRLFMQIRDLLAPDVLVKSDSNPHYPKDVAQYFPHARHRQILGKRGSLGGQGELKKVRFDPLFSLNHTCAKLRADVNRLFRKTWCTTKKLEYLQAHLNLYANFHNEGLKR